MSIQSPHKIFLITDILYVIFDNFRRQDDIYTLLTVHPIWTRILIKSLWKSPLWPSPKSFSCFIKILHCSTPYFPYSTLIRHLSFVPHRNRNPPSFTQEDILFLSKTCTNLTNLSVSWMQDPFNSYTFSQFLINSPNLISITAPSCTIEWLTNALNPIITNDSVKSLHHIELKNWSYETQETVIILQKISTKCPKIKSISAPLLITQEISSLIISSFPQLEKFKCHSVTNEGLKILLTGLRQLKELTLTFNNENHDINDDNSHIFAKDFTKLEKFNLTIGFNSNFPKFFNIFSQYQKDLKELELFHCFGLMDDSFIPITQYCHSLESIKLNWCSLLTDLSFIALAEGRNKYLKRLLILKSGITDLGLKHISENCRNLEILKLEGCREVTLNGIAMIITKCKKLRKLKGGLPKSIVVGIFHEIIKGGTNYYLEELTFKEATYRDPIDENDEILSEEEDDEDDDEDDDEEDEEDDDDIDDADDTGNDEITTVNNDNNTSSGNNNIIDNIIGNVINNIGEILNDLINVINEIVSRNFDVNLDRKNDSRKNIRSRKNFNGKLLQDLSKSCPNLRKLMVKNGKIDVTGDKLVNILNNFKNLERLCIVPSNLRKGNIKQLEKHPRLKEILFIGGCTERAERYIEEKNRNRKIFIKVIHVYGFLH